MNQNLLLKRLGWIDWMKTIGMYFIILGHCFTYGYKYVYVFSVPVFFTISGFLSKRERNYKRFWGKIWYNLIVPMFIICFLYFVYNSITLPINYVFSAYRIKHYFLYALFGLQSSLGTLWFVYTLILLKVIYQYLPNIFSRILLFALSLIGAYLFNHINDILNYHTFHSPNAITNVLVAYPFFIIGVFLSKFKHIISEYNHYTSMLIIFIICIILIIICGCYNDDVWMYKVGYGNCLLLFLIGGLSGSIAIFIISKFLCGFCQKWTITISKGSIIILGFHVYIIWFAHRYLSTPSVIDFFLSLIILIAFIPIILVLERYFPIILGKYRR